MSQRLDIYTEYTDSCSYIMAYLGVEIYMSLYRHVYIYMRLPKDLGPQYIVGVDLLDLTHINLRKVGFDYCDCESLQLLPTWSG